MGLTMSQTHVNFVHMRSSHGVCYFYCKSKTVFVHRRREMRRNLFFQTKNHKGIKYLYKIDKLKKDKLEKLNKNQKIFLQNFKLKIRNEKEGQQI